MSFWSGEKLLQRLEPLIKEFDANQVDCNAYTLRIGREVYVTPDAQKKIFSRHTKMLLWEDQPFAIPPGQFGFLMTEETVKVPNDAIAFISVKAAIKFQGLINVSGFHVDPGYDGHLIFSVFNAGPSPIHLNRGMDAFLIWYADLDQSSTMVKDGQGHSGIENSLIKGMSQEVLSLQSLSKQLQKVDRRVKIQIGIFGFGMAMVLSLSVGMILLVARVFFSGNSGPIGLF